MNNLTKFVIHFLSLLLIMGQATFADEIVTKTSAKKELKSLIESQRNEITKSVKDKNSLNKFLKDLVDMELSSETLNEDVSKKLDKMNVFNLDSKSRSKKISDLLFLEGKSCRKILNACAVGNDECCSGSVCRETSTKGALCVQLKKDEQACDISLNQCENNNCRLLTRSTDLNTCSIAGDECSDNSQCCSKSCNTQTKSCEPNYLCTSCSGQGVQVQRAQKCCDGLYPNENNICVPIIPLSSLLINKFLDLVVTKAHAGVSTDVQSKVVKITKLSSLGQSIAHEYDTLFSECNALGLLVDRNSCKDRVSAQIDGVLVQLDTISRQQESIIDSSKKFLEAANKLNNSSSLNTAELNEKLLKDLTACPIDYFNSWKGDINSGEEKLNETISCLNSVNAQFQEAISDIEQQIMQLSLNLMGSNDKINFISQGTVQSDYSLYNNYDKDAPMLKDAKVSDMNVCRVDLFGDYLSQQNDNYYNVMVTLLGMDFITSGGGTEDFFTVDKWNYQTQALEEDIENFKQSSIKSDIFNFEYATLVKKEIDSYYSTLNEIEKKIFGYLFKHSFVGANEKTAILRYFMDNDDTLVNGTLAAYAPPSSSSFNLYKITRFEAVKFKLFSYKLYGKLKRKSIEMMCRCVDTLGPMKGDDWLEEDVEADYIRECRGRGKYDLFVVEDNSCTKLDDQGNCLDVENKNYISKTLEKEQDNFQKETNKTTQSTLSNKVVTTLDDIKVSSQKFSKADKFIVNGKVTFTSERGENKAGLGEGLIFTEFLRDMAIMKVEALVDVATNNIFTISNTLTITSQFINTYNWGYQKTRVEKFDKSKKYNWFQLILAWMIQLITGEDTINKAGTFVTGAMGSTSFMFDGRLTQLKDVISDSLTSLDLRPHEICEKRKYKSKTWKKGFVPIGKIYYYRCVRNHVENNDVCNEKLPVGMCMKSVFVTTDSTRSSFIIDPFIPEGVSLTTDDQFLKKKVVRSLMPSDISEIKSQAKVYLKSQFYNYSDAEAEEFAEFVYKYHFWYPKKARLVRYMTQGLIPYYERLIEKANALNMAIYNDLFNTSAFALQMHNAYSTVAMGLQSSVLMGQEVVKAGEEIVYVSSNGSAYTNFLSGLSPMNASGDFDFNASNAGLMTGISNGSNSNNTGISALSNALRNSISLNEKRQNRENAMKSYLSKNGSSSDYDKLKQKKSEKESYANKVASLLESSLRNSLGSSNSNSLGSSKSRASNKSNNSNDTDNKNAKGDISSSYSGGDGLVGSAASGKGDETLNAKNSSKSNASGIIDEALLDLSDLDGKNIEGVLLGAGGEILNPDDVKDYLKDNKINISKMDDPGSMDYLNGSRKSSDMNDSDFNQDSSSLSLFEKVSRRYQRSAYPRFLKIRKTK